MKKISKKIKYYIMNKHVKLSGIVLLLSEYKLKRIIKFVSLLLFITFPMIANNISQYVNISLPQEKATVKNIINSIHEQTGYEFSYDATILDREINFSNVTIKKDEHIENVLKIIFKNADISFKIQNNRVFLKDERKEKEITKTGLPAPVIQQQNSITGKVVDTSDEPVIGANVVIRGTTNGTITNVDGEFTLTNVPESGVLIISYIGYIEQQINISGRTSFTIVLKEDAKTLDEVVVVGYGTQKKANLTGAVSTVKYNQELENRPITDPSQALSGKMTGMWVSQNSGEPGSDGATIRVRGYGTLNNTDPLILIDGIEGRMAELNPNDIASITVLKDAASAAIYGSRAANGVILIETKRGEGDKISINYNGYFGMKKISNKYDIITDSPEYMRLWNTAFTNSGSDPLFPEEVIQVFETGNDPYKYPSTNYFDEVLRSAFTTQHNISATAGGKKSTNYISLSYLKDDGIFKNSESERYSLTLNNETKVNSWLKLGGRARLMRKITTDAYEGIGRVIYMMANGHPFSTPYLQDGKTYGGTQALYISGEKAGQPIVDTRNPFPDLYNGQRQRINSFMKGNVYATIDFMEGLSLTAQYSGQFNINTNDRYNQSAYCYTDLNGSNQTKPLDFPSTLNVIRNVNDEYYSTFYTNLNFNRTFAEIHDISAILGYQQEALVKRTTTAQKTDPSKEDLHQVSSGTMNPTANGNKFQWRMLSYFGRVNYALMDKYLMEVNLRADASSRFAKGNRWGYFPSFSAGWRLGEEGFIKNMGIFDNLKIRASWGKLGNQNIGSDNNTHYFPYLTVLTQDYGTSYNFNNTLAPGAAVTSLVDPGITWETTTTTDIGLDLGVLQNRLNIEADYFMRKTTDIIVQLPIPTVLGNMSAPYENVGEMENKGIEFNVNWQDRIPGSDFSYRVGANVTYVDNKVTKFREGKAPDQLYLIREGYSYKTLYGFIFDGIYQTNDEAKQHMHSNGYMPVAGDIRYKDVNGDGKLDYQDKQEIGNTIPKFTYGINAELTWKNFNLNLQFSGMAGVNGYFQNAWTEPLGISGGTITKRWRDAWSPTNPSTTLPQIKVNDTWNRQQSSFWACNMSWFKLKNIQLGYALPKEITQKMFLQQLYVYANATDLFTLVSNDYEGFNPERDTFADGYGHYPISTIFTLGLNVTF
ncbi:MAG: SusC/RagA family TonB-linked outer membrane protein [Tannerellaceae bacterium]|nr:SusC/RagA family TonB-linked outer membrane protein [Tannerellaceae bacterium]